MTATDQQIEQLRRHAVNDVTRAIMAEGIMLTHAEADDLGEETLAWMGSRLGLTVTETDEGVECTPPAEANKTVNIYRAGGAWCYALLVDDEHDHSDALDVLDSATESDAAAAALEAFPGATVVRVADVTSDGMVMSIRLDIEALVAWMRTRPVRADANPYNPRVLRLVTLDGHPEVRWAEHLTPSQERALLSAAAETTNTRSW